MCAVMETCGYIMRLEDATNPPKANITTPDIWYLPNVMTTIQQRKCSKNLHNHTNIITFDRLKTQTIYILKGVYLTLCSWRPWTSQLQKPSQSKATVNVSQRVYCIYASHIPLLYVSIGYGVVAYIILYSVRYSCCSFDLEVMRRPKGVDETTVMSHAFFMWIGERK